MRIGNLYRSSRAASVFLILFAMVTLCFAALLPFLLDSPLPGFVLMGLPMIFVALAMLLQGLAGVSARIEITGDELKMVLPAWRGFPVPPMRRATLKWDEVLAVRRRVEIYTVLIPPVMITPFAVEVYAIDTSRGRFVAGKRAIRRLPEAIDEISLKSGHPIQSRGEVRVGLFRCLVCGAPDWR